MTLNGLFVVIVLHWLTEMLLFIGKMESSDSAFT